ncbi:hypothetical protein D3C75_1317800 [compost metagenome]
MRAVKGRAGIGRDVERARRLSGDRVQGNEAVARGEPHLLAVVRQPMDGLDAREWAIFAEDFGL